MSFDTHVLHSLEVCRLLAVALNTMSILSQFTTERTKAQGNYVPCLSVQTQKTCLFPTRVCPLRCYRINGIGKKGAIRKGYISRDQCKTKTGAPYSKIIKNFKTAQQSTKPSTGPSTSNCAHYMSTKLAGAEGNWLATET